MRRFFSVFRRILKATISLRILRAQPGFARVLETTFEADYVLLDLLDEGEGSSEPFQAFIGAFRGLPGCGAFGDEACVEAIVLGALELVAGEGFDLHGLQEEDGDALVSQMGDDALLVAAGGFDADTANFVLFEKRAISRQPSGVFSALSVRSEVSRATSRKSLPVSMPAVVVGFVIFVVPALLANLGSGDHAGRMKKLVRSCYGAATSSSAATRSDHPSGSAADGRLRQSVPLRNGIRLAGIAITRGDRRSPAFDPRKFQPYNSSAVYP